MKVEVCPSKGFVCVHLTYRRHGGGAVAGAVARLLAGSGDPLQSESFLLKKTSYLRNEEMQLIHRNWMRRNKKGFVCEAL